MLNHLGIRLYSSALAVLTELVDNAWDADATEVHIDLDAGNRQIITRAEVDHGWRAVSEILVGEGQSELATQVEQFIERMKPMRTEREHIVQGLIEQMRKCETATFQNDARAGDGATPRQNLQCRRAVTVWPDGVRSTGRHCRAAATGQTAELSMSIV